MHDRQVPRTEWYSFFRGFSQRHADCSATVRVLSPRFGCHVEARDLPLEGIVADRAGRGPISIHLGCDPRRHVEHEIEDPIQVWVELAEDGAEDALDIESEGGTRTLLMFRPETVDDVLRRS